MDIYTIICLCRHDLFMLSLCLCRCTCMLNLSYVYIGEVIKFRYVLDDECMHVIYIMFMYVVLFYFHVYVDDRIVYSYRNRIYVLQIEATILSYVHVTYPISI